MAAKKRRRRNYAAMTYEKLQECYDELARYDGDAYDRCVDSGSGDPDGDLEYVAELIEERRPVVLGRWEYFTDRELKEINDALATAPSAGTMRAHELMAEITVEANRRGEDRAGVILS